MTFSRIASWGSSLLAAALVWAPKAALACSVCTAGRDDATRNAFLATTVLLTLLPLGLVGGIVWWLRRRALALDELESRQAREPAPGAIELGAGGR